MNADEKLKAKQKDADGRVPACWSPYYWLMVYNQNTPLTWSRYFAYNLTLKSMRDFLGSEDFDYKPLNNHEKNELLDFLNRHLPAITKLPSIENSIDLSKTYWDDDMDLSYPDWDMDEPFYPNKEINFSGLVFPHGISFSRARFYCTKQINFSGTRFLGKKTVFSSAQFDSTEGVNFQNAEFNNPNGIFFNKIKLHPKGILNFQDARFESKEIVYFHRADFSNSASFHKAIFSGDGEVNFSDAKFTSSEKTDFSEAQFLGSSAPNFWNIKVKNLLSFENARFKEKLFLTGANLSEAALNLNGIDLQKGINLDGVIYPENAVLPKQKPETAQIAWCKLRNAVKEEDNRQIELALFTKELEAWAQSEKTPAYVPALIGAYGFFSDYGRSIARPIFAWLAFVTIFALIYAILAWHIVPESSGAFALVQAFLLSLRDATFFLTLSDNKPHKKMIEALFCGGGADHCGVIRYYVYPLLQLIHKLISLPLIFLFGLGVRNALRT